MKIRDVLKRLKHATKGGVVVVPGHPSKDMKAGTLQSVWKQAGLA